MGNETSVQAVVEEEVTFPTCTSGCNEFCFNGGEHCCRQDGNTCYCKPIGVSCASEPVNETSVQAVVEEEVSFPTCTSGCNEFCFNGGEHCCRQDGNTCYCK